MNKVTLFFVVFGLSFALVYGINWLATPSPVKPDQFSVVYVDGVRCIVYRGYRKGGLSCDWKKE